MGADYACLIPVLVKTAGNLQFMKKQFGYCIRGSCGFDRENKLKGITVVVNHVSFYPSKENREITPLCKLKKYFNYFFTIDGLGIQCYPTCGGCACGKCSVSIFLVDPSVLPNNYVFAYARLKVTDWKKKWGKSIYVDHIQDMIERGVARKLFAQEVRAYKGLVFYITPPRSE